jgi:H+/gluconate symporter-like permease
MPDHSFEFSPKLLMKLFAASFLLYIASQSFFVAIFLVLAVGTYIKKRISRFKPDGAPHDARTAPASAAPTQSAVVPPQPQPIQTAVPKRQYAKSAVVIPFKTGTDN